MRTRCKFNVQSVKKYSGNFEEVELSAVYDNSPGNQEENQSFSAATPSGKLTITVSNPKVVGTFVPGKNYYLDLIPVEE